MLKHHLALKMDRTEVTEADWGRGREAVQPQSFYFKPLKRWMIPGGET